MYVDHSVGVCDLHGDAGLGFIFIVDVVKVKIVKE